MHYSELFMRTTTAIAAAWLMVAPAVAAQAAGSEDIPIEKEPVRRVSTARTNHWLLTGTA